jgi:nucleotide-binding universal stress UspA family protein
MTNVTPKPGCIIVGADGSAEAGRAVQWAAEQASVERRPLVVVTAVQSMVPMAAPLGGVATGAADVLIESGTAIAAEAAALAQRHRPGITVETLVAVGEAREVLVETSAGAQLLVLGSRGRGTIRSKLLGSVSASVSKRAQCPVVVCRPGTELMVKRGVVVGADGTLESLPVVEFAFRQAALHSLPLTIVHCFWDVVAAVDSPRVVPDTEPDLEATRLLLAESVAGFRELYPEVYVTQQVVRGHVADCLAALADRHDLVVIGRHPIDSLGRNLKGAVSTAVTERVHTTVAVVPEEPAA